MNITFPEKKLINSFVREQEAACLEYVSRNVLQLLNIFHMQGPDAVRFELHLVGSQYDDLWLKVLNILLQSYSGEKIHERQKEHVKYFFRKLRKAFSLTIFLPQ